MPAGQTAGATAFLLVVAFIAGLARGFSGFGAALIFVPMASAAVGPKLAAGVLMLIDGVLTLPFLPDAWRRANRTEVFTMTSGALLGVPLGTAVLAHADPLAVRWAISLLVVLLLALLVSGWRYRSRPTMALTIGAGGLAGFLSGLAQVGGPPVVAYWLGGLKAPGTVRANIILYFALAGVIGAVSYVAGGLITRSTILFAMIAAPAYGVGLLFGARAFGLADEAVFRRISYGLIALAAAVGLPALDGIIR